MTNSFSTRTTLTVGSRGYEIFRPASLEDRFNVQRLPYSLKILLENLLRFEDGNTVTANDIEALAPAISRRSHAGRSPSPVKVVPPDTGIVHQVNLEYLARVVFANKQNRILQAYPDTLVRTDAYTTMVSGAGVPGWGVGG